MNKQEAVNNNQQAIKVKEMQAQKNSIVVTILLLATQFLNAQDAFHNAVRIEFEKVIYVRQQYKELFPDWYDEYKDNIPEKVVNYYEFIGDTAKSLFRQTKEAEINPRMWYQQLADKNVVYNNYSTQKTITQKPVYEETFLIEDSLTKIKWKLTGDIRTIAGYDCRKAIGFVDDTVAIFAFYTDEILVNGGPEGVHGLPGMILGVGVPRLHATWFATKVEVNAVPLNAIIPATKGKKVTRQGMIGALNDVLKNWGKHGRMMIMSFVI